MSPRCGVCSDVLRKKTAKYCSMKCMGTGRIGKLNPAWKEIKKGRQAIDINRLPPDVVSRFWHKVNKSDGCWEWTANKDFRGYGSLRVGKTQMRASRLSWTINRGMIPCNLFVCHSCDNTSCVNPRHLFLGTQVDNMRDMLKKGRDNYARGEACGTSKLTTRQVLEIRESNLPQRVLAKVYGVGQPHVGRIKRKERWCHIG